MAQEAKRFYEFSSFRLDAARRVLFMQGTPMLLPPKVFNTLLILVERRGQVVEKAELMKRLWPDSFVEEANLTQNVSLLRKLLGESPNDHRYIVTVPGRGYRFVAEVTESGDEETQLIIEERTRAHIVVTEEEKASEPKQIGRASLATEDQLASSHEPAVAISGKSGPPVLVRIAMWLLRLTGAVVSALVVVGLGWYVWQRTGPSTELTQRQLTTNSSETPVTAAAISPDGKYIAYADKSGIYLRLLETGEMHPLPTPPGSTIFALAWFPGGTKLLVSGGAGQPNMSAIWAISILGGAPRKLRDDAGAASASPDGTHIVFTSGSAFGNNGKEIWMMGANGEDPQRIVAGAEGNSFPGAFWFPNGQLLLYGRLHLRPDTAEVTIESRDLKGDPANVILSDLRLTGGCLLPDGRIIYSMAEPPPNDNDANLWEIRIDTRTGQANTKPRRITSWTGFSLPGLFSVTADGKHVAFLKRTAQADVYVGELKGIGARLESPRRLTLNDRNDFPADNTSVPQIAQEINH